MAVPALPKRVGSPTMPGSDKVSYMDRAMNATEKALALEIDPHASENAIATAFREAGTWLKKVAELESDISNRNMLLAEVDTYVQKAIAFENKSTKLRDTTASETTNVEEDDTTSQPPTSPNKGGRRARPVRRSARRSDVFELAPAAPAYHSCSGSEEEANDLEQELESAKTSPAAPSKMNLRRSLLSPLNNKRRSRGNDTTNASPQASSPSSSIKRPQKHRPRISLSNEPQVLAAPRRNESRRMVSKTQSVSMREGEEGLEGEGELCCCGLRRIRHIESMYDLCIKPIKKEYLNSHIRKVSWALLMTQILVLTAYLIETSKSCVPPDIKYSNTVTWGLPLCCIYASADSLKEIFRFMPLALYGDDEKVTLQARIMSACVMVLALYQMLAIGLIMSQTVDIISLISNFVGITIVTKSDELIADILQLLDINPTFLHKIEERHRNKRRKEREEAEFTPPASPVASPLPMPVSMGRSPSTRDEESGFADSRKQKSTSLSPRYAASPADSRLLGSATLAKVAHGPRHMLRQCLMQIAGSYKNPIKRLVWISLGAVLIGLVTMIGRQRGMLCQSFKDPGSSLSNN